MTEEIYEGTIDELKFDPNNANQGTEHGKELLKKSLDELGVGRGVVLAADKTIIGGNHVTEAMRALGKTKVVFVPADGDTLVATVRTDIQPGTKEFHELALADNKVQQENLSFDMAEVERLGAVFDIDTEAWGFTVPESEPEQPLRSSYSPKVGEVLYEPKQTVHRPSDLFCCENKFETEINALVDPVLREMMRARACFFTSFNFSKIADYYAYQATPDEQRLFEKLGLVLLDKDGLIENGFSDIIDEVKELNGFSDTQTDADHE
jgi:hypothetical protein